ncbi:Ribokinase-like protein [Aspergillus californicus]
MSLVAVGACYVDTILTTPHYPEEDEKLRASTISHRRGGNCPNSLEVLQQLIAQSSPAAQVPLNLVALLPARSSVATQQIRHALEPNVSLSHCIYREEYQQPASSYIIKSQSSGSRTIVNYNELPEMTLGEFKRITDELGHVPLWFHFEGRMPDVTLTCIRHARDRFPSVVISVEIEKPGRSGLQELAGEADVVFFSKSWAQNNGYNSGEECVREQSRLASKASLLCCTWGQDGAAAFEPKTGSIVHSPAYKPPDFHVIDTIGAGDTLIAGMLYGLIYRKDTWTLSQKLAFANRLAGTKIAQEGFSRLGHVLDAFS